MLGVYAEGLQLAGPRRVFAVLDQRQSGEAVNRTEALMSKCGDWFAVARPSGFSEVYKESDEGASELFCVIPTVAVQTDENLFCFTQGFYKGEQYGMEEAYVKAAEEAADMNESMLFSMKHMKRVRLGDDCEKGG